MKINQDYQVTSIELKNEEAMAYIEKHLNIYLGERISQLIPLEEKRDKNGIITLSRTFYILTKEEFDKLVKR